MGGVDDDLLLIRRAVEGAPGGRRDLVRRIGPAIHAEIAMLLHRFVPAHGRNARQEVEDLIQDAFVALFDRESKRLRGWDPSRGCTLDSYVRMVARSRALDVLRSRRRTPWREEELTAESDNAIDEAGTPDHLALARNTLEALSRTLQDQLGPRDYSLFVAVFVEELPVADVAVALGLTTAAVYQWTSRFRRNTLPRLAEEFGPAPARAEPA